MCVTFEASHAEELHSVRRQAWPSSSHVNLRQLQEYEKKEDHPSEQPQRSCLGTISVHWRIFLAGRDWCLKYSLKELSQT